MASKAFAVLPVEERVYCPPALRRACKGTNAPFLWPHLVERLFGLEYQSVDWVFWHAMSVQHLDQLPTFHSIVFKNCFYLIIEIYIRSKLDSLNSVLPFSHFRPPLPSGSNAHGAISTRELNCLRLSSHSLPTRGRWET